MSLEDIKEVLKLVSEDNLHKLLPDQQNELLDAVLETLSKLARESFYVYVLLMGPLIVPEGFKDGRHIEIICNALQSLYESIEDPQRATERVQIFLPPRAMKSRMGSILFPSWVLGRKPDWNIICVGNSVKFAEDEFGRNVRDLIRSKAYRFVFPNTELRTDAKAVGLFTTTAGGKYMATGAGAQLAGRGAHLVICDDVLSEQSAISKSEKNKINRWYISGLRSRLSPTPQGGELIINTRWALDDLSGHMVHVDAKGKRPWKIISVPAILDEAGSKLLKREGDPEGLYDPGTSFWPEFQPLGELEERRREFETEGSPEKWHALYLQNPIPPQGNIIKYEDWNAWDNESPPVCSKVVIGMDTAFSISSKADYSAYVVLGVFSVKESGYRGEEYWRNHSILLQAGRGRWDFGTLCEKCLELNRSYKPDVFVIEKRASGQSLIQEMKFRGLPVFEFLTDKDKESRLHSVAPLFKAKTVWYPDTDDCREWSSVIIDEVCTFPSGANDDLVDALSSALIYLRENVSIVHPDDYVLQSGEDFDDDTSFGSKVKTYWSSILKQA